MSAFLEPVIRGNACAPSMKPSILQTLLYNFIDPFPTKDLFMPPSSLKLSVITYDGDVYSLLVPPLGRSGADQPLS